MIRLADLGRLVALRRMREGRAERAVTAQVQACRTLAEDVEAAEVALDVHAAATRARERAFFETILKRPMPQTSLTQVTENALVSAHREEALEASRQGALAAVHHAEAALAGLMAVRVERRRQAEKLAEVARLLGLAETRRLGQSSDLSAEDDVTCRPPRGY